MIADTNSCLPIVVQNIKDLGKAIFIKRFFKYFDLFVFSEKELWSDKSSWYQRNITSDTNLTKDIFQRIEHENFYYEQQSF